jgi:hypothetical protein
MPVRTAILPAVTAALTEGFGKDISRFIKDLPVLAVSTQEARALGLTVLQPVSNPRRQGTGGKLIWHLAR